MAESSSDNELSNLRAEVEDLKAQLGRLVRPETHTDRGAGDVNPSAERTDRRGLLKAAGAAAIGAIVAGLAMADPAAAADGGNMLIGSANASTSMTSLTNSGTGDGLDVESTANSASAIVGHDTSSAGGIGVSATSTNGYGINATTIASGRAAVNALDESSNGGYAVRALAVGYGVYASGLLAPLVLAPQSAAGPPTAGTHQLGEIWSDVGGLFYQCVKAGTPGTWIKISPLVPVNPPQRAYDSRSADGPLSSGDNRVISLTPGGLPTGAAIALVNLTIVNTVGRGFLAIYEEGTTYPGTSNLNWYANSQVVANNATPGVSATSEVTVFAGGSGQTDFIVDVSGYYF